MQLLRQTVVLTAERLGQSWAGIPGIEVTLRGRLFVVCFSGGAKEPDPENTVYLSASDDAGEILLARFTETDALDGASLKDLVKSKLDMSSAEADNHARKGQKQ